MARMYFYVTTAIVMALLLNLFNFTTTNNQVLEETGLTNFKQGNQQLDFSAGDFFKQMFGSGVGILVLAASLGGIIVSFFSRSQPENYVILPFITTTLILFVSALWDIVLVSGAYPNWIRIPVIIIAAPFTLGYVLTMVEWFRGNV